MSAYSNMDLYRSVEGQEFPDTRMLINGYMDDYCIRNPTPEIIQQLWTQGQSPTVQTKYLMDGTYFYIYVNMGYADTSTIFRSVPDELVPQMDSVLDGMPEMTRKWNGISQHTFSFDGAEPRKELKGKVSPLTSEAESEDAEPWDGELTPDTYEYESDGPPPLQSESDSHKCVAPFPDRCRITPACFKYQPFRNAKELLRQLQLNVV